MSIFGEFTFEKRSILLDVRGNDHEVEFHEIKIGGQMIWQSRDQIILPVFMRSKFLIMIRSPDCANFHEFKIPK